jgi:p-hydroxybenzoate 3-monooxygenase
MESVYRSGQVSDRDRTDVCVVGAGPAGLVLALLLQQAEIPCIVLERLSKEAFHERRSGAGLIEHRTVELLDAHGLAQPILAHGGASNVCEFRFDKQAFVLEYGELTGRRGHFIYDQHELVASLTRRFIASDGEIRFGVRVTGAEQDDGVAIVSAIAEPSGEPTRIVCEIVAGCDGARSDQLNAICGASVIELHHPFRWLTLLADVAPSKQRTLYGFHIRGFAGQFRRGPGLTRYMLEIPLGDTIDDWPDDRVWPELQERLHAADEPPVGQGAFIERDVLDLRVRVVEPMHQGRVYLTGDAAHLITPAGGKGMNLAIQDAHELGLAIRERYRDGSEQRLASYTATRLPAIWRTQEFSNWMLTLLHASVSLQPTGQRGKPDESSDFAYRLRRARLQELIDNPNLSRWFAHAYAGVDH